jgi:7,8-dihydropterin-6-yl-methyl-4-(beta-D-ribofuranosyl)aminobenzene 5'-phosphate synthase
MCTETFPGPLPPIQPISTDTEWAGEVIDVEPVDSVTVTMVCDNTIDILLVDEGPAHRLMSHPPAPVPTVAVPTFAEGRVVDFPLAQHGFSAHLSVRKGAAIHTLLFDTGITPTGCADNLDRLGLDPAGIEAIVLSHGHFDHTAGLSGLVGRLGTAGMPVVIHPEFWSRRRIAIPGADPIEMPTTSRRGLEDAGFNVLESRRPSFLFQRSVLITGEVDRTNDFETGFPFHQAWRDSTWEPDPLILDDQALIVNVRGKGLVVLTGCGHAGIINIVSYARRLTGIDAVYAVIGGFHLAGPLFEPRIDATCRAMQAIDPEIVVPAHCTGWRATHALAARLPDAFMQNSVGTAYELKAGMA